MKETLIDRSIDAILIVLLLLFLITYIFWYHVEDATDELIEENEFSYYLVLPALFLFLFFLVMGLLIISDGDIGGKFQLKDP